MIILCAGMQKSGTGWFYNLITETLRTKGLGYSPDIRDKYRLDFWLRLNQNCSLKNMNPFTLALLDWVSSKEETFALKTHRQPTKWLEKRAQQQSMKAIFLYRDPRDVVLSAFDHGESIRSKGQTHTFASLETLESCIQQTEIWLQRAEMWIDNPHYYSLRYEDLKADTFSEVQKVFQFAGMTDMDDALELAVKKYDASNVKKQGDEEIKEKLHINKAQAGRFRQEMDPQTLAKCNEAFKPFLEAQGYAL